MQSFYKGGSFVPRQKGIKPIAHNKKAFHEYFVEDRYECGMSLRGTEVKSVRDGRINLKESFCLVRGGEIVCRRACISAPINRAIFSIPIRCAPRSCFDAPQRNTQAGRPGEPQGLCADSPEGVLEGRPGQSWSLACAGASSCTTSATAKQSATRNSAKLNARLRTCKR